MPESSIGFIPLAGSELPPITGAVASAASPDQAVTVWIALRRKARAPELIVPSPGAPAVDRGEFATTWGASRADFLSVVGFVAGLGIRLVEGTDQADVLTQRLLPLEGTVAAFEKAFRVKLQMYAREGQPAFLGREGQVWIPTELKDVVRGVFGLDQRPVGGRSTLFRPASPGSNLPTPPQIADYYGAPGERAAGQTIALMQFGGGYRQPDLDDYFDSLNLPRVNPIDIGVAGATNSPGDCEKYDKEVTLDIDIVGAVAPGAEIVVYFAPLTEDGWIASLSAAIHDTRRRPSVVSISWGIAQRGRRDVFAWTPNGMERLKALFQEAAVLGITVLSSAGNHGTDCEVGDRRAHVVYPASDPFVIGCGGTTIVDFGGGNQREFAWARGGGGISDVFLEVPAYQLDSGRPIMRMPLSLNTGRHHRGVPDVAGYADKGFTFILDSNPFEATGTSLTTALYAAIIARINAYIGVPVGYIHPALYAWRDLIFRDMPSTTNSNGFGPAPGYYGSVGWDARTGLGVLKLPELTEKVAALHKARTPAKPVPVKDGKSAKNARSAKAKAAPIR